MRTDFDLDLDRSDRLPAGLSLLVIASLALAAWASLIEIGYGLMVAFS